jgi:malate synthase
MRFASPYPPNESNPLFENYAQHGSIKIAPNLYAFINDEALPGTGVSVTQFWDAFDGAVPKLSARNRALIAKREDLQSKIDAWHVAHQKSVFDPAEYEQFLREIGYIVETGEPVEISTTNVDPEISTIAGPQLVVPVSNARYALNAANARWGSLYDALYGTDAILPTPDDSRAAFSMLRARAVMSWAREFLDTAVPLANGSWTDIGPMSITDGKLDPVLQNNSQFIGYTGSPSAPTTVMVENNGLKLQLIVDASKPTGQEDAANIADVRVEAAITTIMDCEDSVAAVDSDDKVAVYRNWLGLMRGDLSADVTKRGQTIERRLNPDLTILAPDGEELTVAARSLMLVRNVGSLMTTDAVLDDQGDQLPEEIMDAFVTGAIALHDIGQNGRHLNSRAGSVYIVKPKMHGPEEVAFAGEIFAAVESALGLPAHTLKMGIMDEERRTSVNLAECIRAAKQRVVFINTGFLDRTGDEMHTSMEAGPMVRKGEMKRSAWITAYEDRNVDIGLQCGLSGQAQIGKGMWAMPDLMADMLAQKIDHPRAGANTAWVPSPTAATLHATHYHRVSVTQQQLALRSRAPTPLQALLTIPLSDGTNWSESEIKDELDNNAQGILGYVVRWIGDGIGCSKVPDINDVGLMEDRATLRISAQHMANWLHHGVVQASEVQATMERMARRVDEQNAGEPGYVPMSDNFDNSISFQAACELVFEGRAQPSGYTEPVLHRRRRELKRQLNG